MPTFYDTLEISPNATQQEIKQSFRRLAMTYHTDKNKEGEEKFKQINEAYQTLGDVEKRRQYDQRLREPENVIEMGIPASKHSETQASRRWSSAPDAGVGFANSEASALGRAHANASFAPDLFEIFPDPIFRHLFGGMPFRHSSGHFQQKSFAPPLLVPIEIELTKIVNSDTSVPIEVRRNNGETETIYVLIPQGADDGEIITIKEKGNVSTTNINGQILHEYGDLKIQIHVTNPTEFVRQGLDLVFRKTLTLKEALCGSAFVLKHINGHKYKIENKCGVVVAPNMSKVIEGYGISRNGGSQRGNLIVVFEVQFPESLTPEQVVELEKIL